MAEAASDSVAESWEGIESLSLSDRPQPESSQQAPAAVEAEVGVADVDKPATPPPAECSSSQPQQPAAEPDAQQAPVYEGIDAAIRQALADPIQRLIVYKCEELVEKFIADPCSPVLQFPANFSSYQRMLAHRVGQYYGLQTSTVDYEENQGRVVAVRTESCANPKPRLRLLDLRGDPIAMEVRTNTQPYRPLPGHASASGADKPRLLRRQDDDRNMQGSSDNSMNPSPTRSMKERHEDYMKAREQLGLGSGPAQDGMAMGRGRGGPGGRYGPGALGGGRMDGGRGRKAVFRDKDKELNDPDYRRGMNRFSGAARFDPSYTPAAAGGMYQVPTYQTEFPTLGRMQSGPGPTGRGGPMGHMGQPMQPGPGQAHGAAPGQAMGMGPGGPMGLSVQHGAHGQGASWGQGVRPPPPPPPPHHVAGGNGSKGPMGQGGSGQGRNGGGGGGQQQGAASGQQGQQQQAVYGMAAVPYPSSPGMSMGVAQQFSVPMMAAAPGYVTAGPGQAVYGMTAAGQPNVIPAGALYAAPAPAGAAFYPAAVGIPGMAAGTYGYVAAGPAPGSPEAVTVAPGAFHPTAVYGGYPAGPAMYSATAQMTAHGGALHPTAGGGAMRPVYGVQYYQAYDASGGQYDGSGGQQGGGSRQSGDGHHPGREQQGGRNYSGGYGGGGGGGGGHYGGVRGGRDYEGGSSGRGDQQHQSSGAGGAAGGGHDRGK